MTDAPRGRTRPSYRGASVRPTHRGGRARCSGRAADRARRDRAGRRGVPGGDASLFAHLREGEWVEPGTSSPTRRACWCRGSTASSCSAPAPTRARPPGWLDELAFRGLPHAVLSRPAAPRLGGAAGRRLRAHHVEHEPLMVPRRPGRGRAAPRTGAPGRARDRRGRPGRPGRAATPASSCWPTASRRLSELLAPLMGAELLVVPGDRVRTSAASTASPAAPDWGPWPTGTSACSTSPTPPALRRRGYGHAVTARIVADGVRLGARTRRTCRRARWATRVYERIGFRTVETWACYYPA